MTNILEDGINRDHGELLFAGDFNIHMDNTLHSDTTTFLEFMESYNLRNHTNFATYISNHYLDLALTEHGSTVISKIDRGDMFSNHHFVDLKLAVSHPIPKPIMVSIGNLEELIMNFSPKTWLNLWLKCMILLMMFLVLWKGITSFTQVLDKHAPVKSKTVGILIHSHGVPIQ